MARISMSKSFSFNFILFLCFSVLLALRLPRFGKRERAYLSAFRKFVRFVLIWQPSSSWCLGRAAVCDCGNPWTFSYLFFKLLLSTSRFKTLDLSETIAFKLFLYKWFAACFKLPLLNNTTPRYLYFIIISISEFYMINFNDLVSIWSLLKIITLVLSTFILSFHL